MPPPASPGRSYPVRFDPDALAEDTAHATSAGQAVTAELRRELETGRFTSQLRRGDIDARDPTSLPNCVKTYLPAPDWPVGCDFWAPPRPRH